MPMSTPLSTVTVALVQSAPVLFDRDATVAKACALTADAAAGTFGQGVPGVPADRPGRCAVSWPSSSGDEGPGAWSSPGPSSR